MIRTCINCSQTFETDMAKKVACTRKCSQSYRQRYMYKDKYSVVHRSLNPRNFLRCLSKKKVSRRDLDIDFLMEVYDRQAGKCALSGRAMTYQSGIGRVPTNISIDRIDSSIGYEPSNIQLVCVQANKMKAELDQEELAGWCEDITKTYDKRKKK